MNQYISLLRGINVSGHRIIKMPDLKALYETLNFQNIITYIQSGNVIFNSRKSDPLKIKNEIENKIKSTCNFPVTVIIRTKNDFIDLMLNNPFLSVYRVDISKLYITFLSAPPSPATVSNIKIPQDNPDQLHISGKHIFLLCSNGYGKTKLSNQFFEKKLNVLATTRSWKTILKLYELANMEQV